MSIFRCLLIGAPLSAAQKQWFESAKIEVVVVSPEQAEALHNVSADILMIRAEVFVQTVPEFVRQIQALPVARVLLFESTLAIDTAMLHSLPVDDYVSLDWSPESLRARLEWALVHQSQRLDASLGQMVLSPDAVLRIDNQGKILAANDAVETSLGYVADSIIGRSIFELFAEDSRDALAKLLPTQASATGTHPGRTGEMFALHGDGNAMPVEVYVRMRNDARAAGELAVFIRDISSQQHYRGAYFRHERHMAALSRLTEDLLHSEKDLAYGPLLSVLAPTINAVRGRFYLTSYDRRDQTWARECVAEWWAENRIQKPSAAGKQLQAAIERDEALQRWLPVLKANDIVAAPADSLPRVEAGMLQDMGIKSVLVVPLNMRGKLIGFLRFDSGRDYPGWEAGDVSFLTSAARSICHAHVTLEERRYRIEAQEALYEERVWLETIRQASELISATETLEDRLVDIVMYLLNVIPVDQLVVSTRENSRIQVNGVYSKNRQLETFHRWESESHLCPGHTQKSAEVLRCDQSRFIQDSDMTMRSCVCLPLMDGTERIGTVSLASEEPNVFNERNHAHLESLATQLAHAVVHIQRYRAAKSEAEHLAVIVREVHHRIKNNLQGVIGLLNSHRHRNSEVDQIMVTAIAQLNAVAEAHNQLSRRSDETVFLGDLVAGVHRAVRPLTGHELVIDAPSAGCRVIVPAAEVVPVALVVNELIQNALDHGFETGTGGEIRIEIHESADSVSLRVSNNGKPLPESFDSSSGIGFGTGLTLVRSLIPAKGSRFSLRHMDGWTVAEVEYDMPVIMQSALASPAAPA
ncbi:MAG: PAS domain S-box protein [Gammaproteobacteria bacterium]|nr:PAS domain S-box protein [Gammaproteobacteria bacterium]